MAMRAAIFLHAVALGVAMRHTEEEKSAVVSTARAECGALKPAPAWVEFQDEKFTSGNGYSKTRMVTDFIPTIGTCSDYFIYARGYAKMYTGPDSKCRIYEEGHSVYRYIAWCSIDQNNTFVTKTMPVLCQRKLCDLATTGEWKISDKSADSSQAAQAAKSEPWVARMLGQPSFGYEDAFEKLCWMGDAGKHRPSFSDFVAQWGLPVVTPDGFNKTLCGCPSAGNCSGV
mmetsp:Transcript_34484/g.42482  ORF Transcript_34484/g.42482 Transcript_34484/m.42482 type:complete len:229 (-) Transcript_34484:31-717(-)